MITKIARRIFGRLDNPVVASKSYRYLARQVAQDLSRIPGGKLIVFSAATKMKASSEVLLMFSHFLQNELNGKVLLIDATLRNSGLSQLLQLNDRAGMIDVLSGNEQYAKVDSVIHPLNKNIFFIATGEIPRQELPYASEAQIETLIKQFKSEYDYVIAQQDDIRLDTRYLHFAKKADLVLLHLEEQITSIKRFDEIKEVFQDHQITNVKYILSEP